jgi:hypothetical protein
MERANRKLRFDEKVRYEWRSWRSLDRFPLPPSGTPCLLAALTQPPDEGDLGLESPPALGAPPYGISEEYLNKSCRFHVLY